MHNKIFNFVILFITLATIINCHRPTPLEGKKIIVTAPKNYNHRLAKLINKERARAISMPVIDISFIQENKSIDSILYNISKYKWIALPSRNAIKAFFTRAKEINIESQQINKAIYCAIGKDIDYLKHFKVDSILVPREASPQGIVEEIKQCNPTNENIAVCVPLVKGLPEPNVVPNFIKSLKQIGLNVKRVNAYTTSLNKKESYSHIIEAIKNNKVDLIAFTSSAEIEALIYMVGGIEKLEKTSIACFGPYTASNAKKLGLNPVFISKDYSSFNGYIKSMKEYFESK